MFCYNQLKLFIQIYFLFISKLQDEIWSTIIELKAGKQTSWQTLFLESERTLHTNKIPNSRIIITLNTCAHIISNFK